ncbi:hypothetical protein FXW30_02645 [Candidatus Liberibacter asiaticus]|nr:hypothetical protein FXW22_02865 [Candidatus Liberibacter asiaticus]KAE9519669.1 hypothetical protein FXW29_03155 [Candidatus Liberibacter asiaticus]KAE9520718.1 hypothetical protein FXW30_02645 [Candidatus Liberibacter asiaticus]
MTPREHKNLIRKKKMIARNLLSPAYRHMKSISLADLGAKKIPLKKKNQNRNFLSYAIGSQCKYPSRQNSTQRMLILPPSDYRKHNDFSSIRKSY